MDKQSRLWMSYERIMQVKTRLYVYCESRQILTDTMKSKINLSWKEIISLHYQMGFQLISKTLTLRQNCPYLEFFWSVFSCIWNECGKIQTRKTPNKNIFYNVKINFLRRGLVFFIQIFYIGPNLKELWNLNNWKHVNQETLKIGVRLVTKKSGIDFTLNRF